MAAMGKRLLQQPGVLESVTQTVLQGDVLHINRRSAGYCALLDAAKSIRTLMLENSGIRFS
jgi:hypothetical protein